MGVAYLGEARRSQIAERHQAGDVVRMQHAVARRRDVQQQLRVAADRLAIDVEETVGRLHPRVLGRMVKPARPNRRVRLRRAPHRAVAIPVLQRVDDAWTADAWRRHSRRIDGGPVRLAGRAVLVAAPADVGPRVREDDGIRLEFLDETERARPVVDLPLPVGSFAVGAVEPHFVEPAVLRQQLGQLIGVDVVVSRRVAVGGMIPVPRRQIEPGAEPFGPAGIDELAHHVAAAATPRAFRDGVRRRFGRPETEPVVMLGGEDHGPEAGGACGPGPGASVERGRREDRGILAAVTPLAVGEGIDAEVQEERELVALPRELRGRRAWAGLL